MSWQRPNIGSRVTREGHARFWERPEVKFLRATRHSLTNKVLQTCNGWLMEAKRPDGSPAVVFVDPKTQTIVDADFR